MMICVGNPSENAVSQLVMQQPNYSGATPPGEFANCTNVANIPMMWPMQAVAGEEAQWSPQAHPQWLQPQCASQPVQFAHNVPQNGGFIWMQPVTFWPTSSEGMQAPEATAEDQVKSTNQPKGKQQWGAGAPPTSGARRQRRQRELRRSSRLGNPSSEAALHPEMAGQLRRAVELTEEACQMFRGPSGKLSSAGSEDGSSTQCSSSKLCWADASQDALAAGTPEKVPASWQDFRDECSSESSQQDHSLADAAEADPPKQQNLSRRVRAAAAKDWQPQTSQGAAAGSPTANSEQVHDSTSLQESKDDSFFPEAAADPVLLALEDVEGETFRVTLDEVVSSVWWLAWTKRGSRIVQKAIEVGTNTDQEQIVRQLHGRVLEALKSPHANHVLQKCIEVLPPDQLQFAMTEIQLELSFVARHRFGCRILQRLIEHGDPCQTEHLISELVTDSSRLCRHQFGNFTVQHILQHGAAGHRSAIAKMLCGDTIRLAKHRIASYVISCALSHCATEDVQMLAQVVLHDAGQLADLSRRQYGSFVVREVHRVAKLHTQ
jgi:hypothetical protein